MLARWTLLTPTNARGALAVLALRSEDLDADLAELGISPVAIGRARVRDVLGIDRGLVARWSRDRADLFVHGGVGVVRALAIELEARGVRRAVIDEHAYPEAGTPIQARMLAALADATSPRAVDLLLDQPRRWEAADLNPDSDLRDAGESLADTRLGFLVRPPLVAALGAPNIGKSTLLNTLADRMVSLTADQPGTTRDHVGAMLDLDGLTVRYLDLPGIDRDATGPDADAQRLARSAVRDADLLLVCGDAATDPAGTPGVDGSVGPGGGVLRVALRADLGEPSWSPDVRVSAHTGDGMGDLARAIRRALVPDSALGDPRPWRFWAP
jgi:hypothetical protein